MSDWSPHRAQPAGRTQRELGELLWEIHVDHVFWRAELFDEQAHGFDARLFRGGEFFASQRWANRQAATAWASSQRREIEKSWAPNDCR